MWSLSVIFGLVLIIQAGASLPKAENITVNSEGTNCATIALWLFDEQIGIYPSSILTDAGPNDYPLVLGRGGQLVEGKYGHALATIDPQPLEMINQWGPEQGKLFGLMQMPIPPGRTVPPMSWKNAHFCGFFTCGEKHLRRMEFSNPTQTRLNLGNFNWTVEFWFKPTSKSDETGVIFELGEGPRGENDRVTCLALTGNNPKLTTQRSGTGGDQLFPADPNLLQIDQWCHLAFAYRSSEQNLTYWSNGKRQCVIPKVSLKALDEGVEAYFSVGRDGLWKHPAQGVIDELRFSSGVVYTGDFVPPGSFSRTYGSEREPLLQPKQDPLLFEADTPQEGTINLGGRKHLFLDDALVAKTEGVQWTVNPPYGETPLNIYLAVHQSMVQDDAGLIRIYGQGPQDSLAVIVSKDGVHFEAPQLPGGEFQGAANIVIKDPVGLGNVFIDPVAPPEEHWKYVSGIRGRGIYVYTSPDGWHFTRHETAALPFAAGSQSNVFYDDQRGIYVGYHRSDYGAGPTGHTERRFLLTEVKDLLQAWEFKPTTPELTREISMTLPTKWQSLDPWYLDNGPLSPGGFGIEFPVVFRADPKLDPPITDIYVPKAIKYAGAPDAYLAFPQFYFHYSDTGVAARDSLGEQSRNLGSGVVEVQCMTSRDGRNWKRYPRPQYLKPGRKGDLGTHFMVTTVYGMAFVGDEIWQYYGGVPYYHSAWDKNAWSGKPSLFRVTQRRDGFVSVDAGYTGGYLLTKLVRFTGNRLCLNIDTGATGYAQVGFLDEKDTPPPGFSVDECVYINGDYMNKEVEWLKTGVDVTSLQGREVQIEFRMAGCKLYSLQFVTSQNQ
jgi:hypothetical protein